VEGGGGDEATWQVMGPRFTNEHLEVSRYLTASSPPWFASGVLAEQLQADFEGLTPAVDLTRQNPCCQRIGS